MKRFCVFLLPPIDVRLLRFREIKIAKFTDTQKPKGKSFFPLFTPLNHRLFRLLFHLIHQSKRKNVFTTTRLDLKIFIRRMQDAESAINSMNGLWLGTRKIRTNWATRKTNANENPGGNVRHRGTTSCSSSSRCETIAMISDGANSSYGPEPPTPRLDFNEVWNRTSDTNTTVYFGNCGEVCDELVRGYFERFGHIQEIRLFKEKGYAFIR